MCTIVALRGVHPDYPLVVAANRDEFYARRATSPQVLRAAPRVLGGMDTVSRGTWMGVTPAGFFVGLTNQRTHDAPDPSRASRGPLVLEALARGTTDAVREMLDELAPGSVNPFNLLYGDAGSLEVAYVHGDAPAEITALPPGVHVLSNDRLHSPDFPKSARARALVEPHVDAPWPALRDHLRRVLADHEQPDVVAPPPGSRFAPALLRRLGALCVHTDAYGTCSATLLALVPDAVAHYEFAAGPPCRVGFVDQSELLAARG